MGFFIRLMFYSAPFAVGFFVLTGALVYTGESLPLSQVITAQMGDDPVLYRIHYGNRDQQYKQLAVSMRQPDLLIIGSSRVLQFRAAFANNTPDSFYNAAAPAWTLDEIYNLLTGLDKSALPDVLVLGVDAPWFNVNYVEDEFPAPVSDYQQFFLANRSFIQEILDDKAFDIEHLLARKEPGNSGGIALGFRAIRDGHGFRNDGSEQYGDFLIAGHLWQPNMRGLHTGWMWDGNEMYVYGDASAISEDSLRMMADLLAYLSAQEVEVVGFMPPYMPSLWDDMQQRGNHTYIDALIPQLNTLFAEYGFPLLDYSRLDIPGITDEDFFDGWHPSEKAAALLYADIVNDVPDVLGRFTDANTLRQRASSADNTWDVFGFLAE